MSHHHRVMVRGALRPSAVAAPLLVAGASGLAGVAGFRGAVLAAVLVGFVLGLGLLLMLASVHWSTGATLITAVLTFGISALAAGGVLMAAQDATLVSRPAFAVTAVVLTAVWVGGLAAAHAKVTQDPAARDFPEALMTRLRPGTPGGPR